jgi:hypothetical protein
MGEGLVAARPIREEMQFRAKLAVSGRRGACRGDLGVRHEHLRGLFWGLFRGLFRGLLRNRTVNRERPNDKISREFPSATVTAVDLGSRTLHISP